MSATGRLGWHPAKVMEFFKPYSAEIRMYFYHWGTLPLFLILNLVRLAVAGFRLISWRLNGIQTHLDSTYYGKNYATSAHVLDIVAKCKTCPFDKVRSCFFLSVHNNFTHPKCVLADNVMLAEIRTDRAVFVELYETVDRYSVRNAKFLFLTLVYDAKRLIEMPLVSLHRLAREMSADDPDYSYDKIIFVFGSGRCGSTAVAQIIEEAAPSDTLVFSEPPVLTDFVSYKRCYSYEFYNTTLRSSLRLLLKPMRSKKRLVIKPSFFVCNIAEDIHEHVPKADFIYCYRDPLKNLLAQKRAFGYSPLFMLLQTALVFKIWDYGETYIGFHRNAKLESAVMRFLHKSMFEMCCIIWADNFWRYKEQARKFSFSALYYDDLLEEPALFCAAVLKLSGIDDNQLDAAISALKMDAQEGTGMGQEFLQDVPCNLPDQKTRERVDRFFEELSLPPLNWQLAKQENQPLTNGIYTMAENIRKKLENWEPDHENFCFVKFGRSTLLVQWDEYTKSYIPFSERYA